MIAFFAALCIVLMVLSLALHLFGLPANWVILGLAGLWALSVPSSTLSLGFIGVLACLAFAGEILEMLLLHLGGKKYGGSGKATFAGMLGAFVGAILGAPFFLGVGAFFGALLGAYVAALIVELLRGVPKEAALSAAWGIMVGRFGGTVLKAALGFAMVALAAPRIWPGWPLSGSSWMV